MQFSVTDANMKVANHVKVIELITVLLSKWNRFINLFVTTIGCQRFFGLKNFFKNFFKNFEKLILTLKIFKKI